MALSAHLPPPQAGPRLRPQVRGPPPSHAGPACSRCSDGRWGGRATIGVLSTRGGAGRTPRGDAGLHEAARRAAGVDHGSRGPVRPDAHGAHTALSSAVKRARRAHVAPPALEPRRRQHLQACLHHAQPRSRRSRRSRRRHADRLGDGGALPRNPHPQPCCDLTYPPRAHAINAANDRAGVLQPDPVSAERSAARSTPQHTDRVTNPKVGRPWCSLVKDGFRQVGAYCISRSRKTL